MENSQDQASISPITILWGIASVVLALLVLIVSKTGPIAQAGFLWKILGFIVAVPCGAFGALIGDMLRRFVIPDAVFTTGGFFELLKTKLFWMIGPQTIGLFIGVFLGFSIVLH